MRNVKPEYGFRSRYGYCNMGFVTVGEIIKIVTDTTWESFVKVHLLDPLHMNHTSASWSFLTHDANAATAHTVINDTIIKIPYSNVENIGPCASFNSCVKDLSNWLLMQLDSGRFEGNRIVPFAVLRETWRSQMIVNEPGDPLFPTKHFSTYGLGWFLGDYSGRKVISHSGGANGFVTKTMFIPEEQLGIVVLTNTDANSFYEALGDQIFESYLNSPYRNLSEKFYDEYKDLVTGQEAEIKSWKERTDQQPAPALPLYAYAGKYRNEVYGEIEIRNERGKLNIYFSHHPQLVGHLESFGGNEFVCTYSDLTCGVKKIPFTVANDKVKSVTIRVNDFIDYLPYEFQKVN
jgi:CubicO group peptidase (beta-lactamase class C family)